MEVRHHTKRIEDLERIVGQSQVLAARNSMAIEVLIQLGIVTEDQIQEVMDALPVAMDKGPDIMGKALSFARKRS